MRSPVALYCRLAIVCWLAASTRAHGSHHHSAKQPTSFSDPNVVSDHEHMKQHMQGEINIDKPMTGEEMEFHYFRLHDTNNDTMLDGLEILKALSHMMTPMEFAPHETSGKTAVEIESMKDERMRETMKNYVQIIDNLLSMDDRDQDGYLTYAEYVLARKRDAQKLKEMQERMMREASVAREQMMNKQQQPYNTGL